jgi:tRNA threonylcarbamoyladenosine biosynthesis protein TsaE
VISPTTAELATRRATSDLARRLGPLLKPSDLVILTGPLGAGKTYFTRALCRVLGLPEDTRVPSPTFTLVHEHDTDPPLSHADLYRVSTSAQVRQLGLDAQRDDGRVLVVEWGEPFIAELGGDALVLTFALNPRRVTLSATGRRSSELLAAFAREGVRE